MVLIACTEAEQTDTNNVEYSVFLLISEIDSGLRRSQGI